jgi:hypothetical protein
MGGSQTAGTRSRRHSSASTHASILSVLHANGASPFTRCASATATSQPASVSTSRTNRAPVIDSIAARTDCAGSDSTSARKPPSSGTAVVRATR